jgi:sugar phosphate isomerase/epimerase
MRLSLSTRIGESFFDKTKLSLPFLQLLTLARTVGYDGLCLRATVANVESPPEQVAQVNALIREASLTVSMVTGDANLAANNDRATEALRNITPYLDLAEAVHCQRLRVMIRQEEDLPYARRAADEANERGMLLCHQIHINTLFERVDECLEMLARINRRNFGITYEPANLLAVGDEYGPEQIRRLGEAIVNVYLQNWRLDPDGTTVLRTRGGPVPVTLLPLSGEGGVRMDRDFAGLQANGYDGWVTVHAASLPGKSAQAWAQEYYNDVAPYVR